MFDGSLRKPIDLATAPMGARLARAGVSANAVTLMGLVLGLGAALVIAIQGSLILALTLILASRIADGLDLSLIHI